MKEKGQMKSFTMRRSGWSSFSIIGFVIFGLLLPALLLTHVFVDYATYIAGYAAYAEKTVQASIEEYTNELETLGVNINAAQATVSANQAQIQALESEIQGLENQIKAKKSAKEAAQNAVLTNQAEIDTLNGALRELEAEKAALETERNALTDETQNLEASIQTCLTELNALADAVKERELAVLNAKKQVLQEKIDGLGDENLAEKLVIDHNITALRENITNSQSTVTDKQALITEKTDAKAALATQVADKQAEVTALQPQIDAKKTQINEKKAAITALDTTVANNATAITNLEKEIANAKAAMADLAYELFVLEYIGETLAQEKAALETEKAGLDPVADAERIAELDAQIAAKDAELAANATETDTKNAALIDALEARQNKETQIEDYKAATIAANADKALRNEELTALNTELADLNDQKGNLETAIADLNTQMTALDGEVTTLTEEIENIETQIDGYEAEIVALEKRANGLDATADAEEIAKLEAEIAEIDALIAKWENGELQADATPAAAYEVGEIVSVNEKALVKAIEQLNLAKSNLETKQTEKAGLDTALAEKKTALTAKETALTATENNIATKTTAKTAKEQARDAEQAKVAAADADIVSLNEQVAEKTAEVNTLSQANDAKTHEVEVWEKDKADYEKRVAALNKALTAKGTALLHPEEVALITAFEKDSLHEESPYQAEGANAGLLTTTKMLFGMGLGMSQVELVTYAFAVLSVLFFFGAIIVICNRTRKARATQYVVTENVLQCQTGAFLGKKFILAEGATVKVRKSFKGGFFGYGTLIISMGAGYAGEFAIEKVKSARKMKRLLEAQIARYGKAVQAQQTPMGMPFGQNYPFSIVPFPMMPNMNEEDDEEECPCPYNQPMPCPYED